jgi:hypothetical protein
MSVFVLSNLTKQKNLCPWSVKIWSIFFFFFAYGSIERYKTRLVVTYFIQQESIDYSKTFSPVVKHVTIHSVLTIAVLMVGRLISLIYIIPFLIGYFTKSCICSNLQVLLILLFLLMYVSYINLCISWNKLLEHGTLPKWLFFIYWISCFKCWYLFIHLVYEYWYILFSYLCWWYFSYCKQFSLTSPFNPVAELRI